MKREIKLFCSSNVASVFLKPIILHGIYALNLEKKKRKKMLVFFWEGGGGYFKLCSGGRDSGGEGGTLPPAEDQRGIHIIL